MISISNSQSIYAVAPDPTPVLNIPDFESVFGGSDGVSLKKDNEGLIREVEYIALEGTVFEVLDEIDKDEHKILHVKTDYYDEEDELIKSFLGTEEQKMDGRDIFAHWEMIPYNEPGNKTILDYNEIKFNIKIEQSYFSEQNMKRVR